LRYPVYEPSPKACNDHVSKAWITSGARDWLRSARALRATDIRCEAPAATDGRGANTAPHPATSCVMCHCCRFGPAARRAIDVRRRRGDVLAAGRPLQTRRSTAAGGPPFPPRSRSAATHVVRVGVRTREAIVLAQQGPRRRAGQENRKPGGRGSTAKPISRTSSIRHSGRQPGRRLDDGEETKKDDGEPGALSGSEGIVPRGATRRAGNRPNGSATHENGFCASRCRSRALAPQGDGFRAPRTGERWSGIDQPCRES